jgi:SAM-dependent methyltransferase
LDLGCGTGTNVLTLARHAWQVTGVDFARRAIAIARQKTHQAGLPVDFYLGDVTQLKGIPGPFDLVLDIGCFHSLPPAARRVYARNLPRLLAPQGTLLMYAFFKGPGEDGPGLVDSDLEALGSQVTLVRRVDGSERGRRPSAWLTYQPNGTPERAPVQELTPESGQT